jgi:hypothetical protein
LSGIKTLHTDREAIDAGGVKPGEIPGIDGAGIGLEGDFNIIPPAYQPFARLQQRSYRCGLKQTGCAAAKKNRPELALLHALQFMVEVL